MDTPIVKHISQMTEEEREKVIGKCEKARESYERCKREGLYHCKRDRCKEAREDKEKAEREKEEAVVKERKTLRDRSALLEEHARDMEAKQKKMEQQIEKMANLIAQLIK